METKSKEIKISRIGNFRFKKFKNKVLITNDGGEWMWLSLDNFSKLSTGKIKKDNQIYQELVKKDFVDIDKKKVIKLARKYLRLNQTVFQGTSLFIIVLTLRCNHRCLYCQAIPEHPDKKGFDMNKKQAKKVVDLVFRTPSHYVNIEFQGGEPLLNWETLKYITKYAKKVNKEKKKELKISLVSNLTLLDDEKLKYLLGNDVSISCSFDGPSYIHNKNRLYLEDNNSYKAVVAKMVKVQKAVKAKKKINKNKFVDQLNAVLTVSRFALPYPEKIVDEYLKRGFGNIFIRPLSPFGLERKTLNIIGYKVEDFIKFYIKMMDYILKINLEKKIFIERATFYALKKIMRQEDPGYYEMRSPCGAGIGQMAFDYDGRIFTCDEGRMAARMGYDNFMLGDINENDSREGYNKLIDNEVTKTMCLASSLDNYTECQNCPYKPYCGTCPLANFIEFGTIIPQISNTDRCKINKAMFDYIFLKMKNEKYRAIFNSWLENSK